MRVIVQRVLNGSCVVNGEVTGSIEKGFVLFVGFKNDDSNEEIQKIANKLSGLRIFEDENGKLNLNIKEVDGTVLSISQFSLYANCKRGRRPSFDDVMKADYAREMYHEFNKELRKNGLIVEEGIFQEDMKISLINDGPLTIILDSEEL